MTKTPIERNDIRKGDLIRKEYGTVEGGLTAVEYVAAHEADGGGEDSHFLLNRPKPVVVLPTEPGHYLPSYENPEVHTLDAEGDWWVGTKLVTEAQVKHDCGLGLVKLEPVAETAKDFVAAYRAYSSGANRTVKQLDQAVEYVARKEFGVTP